MRILIGSMGHESNTLNPIITGADDFRVAYGDEILAQAWKGGSIQGIIDTLRSAGAELAPIGYARAVPNGVVSAAFYNAFKAEFMARVKAAAKEGPVDGICLALHGSMKVQGAGSGESFCAEGDFLGELRALLSGLGISNLPITAALDMHATVTPAMLASCNAFAGYKTAPHIDCEETGALAAKMLLNTIETKKPLYTAYCRIPMLIAGEKSESEAEPMRSLLRLLDEAETEPGVQAASYLLGFPWADNEENAACALVCGYAADKAALDAKAAALAGAFWERRADFKFRNENYPSPQALEAAYAAVLKDKTRPVFLSDSGDNPTAGAAGDATELFECVLKTIDTADTLPTPLLYSGFFDKAAVEACFKAGEGAFLDLTIGGNWDTVNGKKIALKVKVEKLVPDYHGSGLALVSYRNLRISLTRCHIGFGDPDLLPALGIDAADYCLVVVKLGYLEPCFRGIAKRAILALSKGCSNEALETIPYKRLKRPIYPLDLDTKL